MTPIGGAQTPTEEEGTRAIGGLTFIDEIDVTVVNVVVHVTGKGGRPVTDLRREDFRILQDGVEKEITNFQLYTEEVYRRRFDEPDISAQTPPPSSAAVLREKMLRFIWTRAPS